jgi:RNA 3'-terminal phosphate cyclase (ATP)
METVYIEGSYGEGGGQVIRTSVSLAAITGRAVEIGNVRAGRTKPGLQPQHLAAVRAAAVLCEAELWGAEIGSRHLRFTPRRPVAPGDYRFEIGTAGAATLVSQTALAPLALAGGESWVTVVGGTHVPHSPPANYLEAVYGPALRRFGLAPNISYPAAGFFPRGGGEVHVLLSGGGFAPVELTERGRLKELRAFIVTSGLPEAVSLRGAKAVEKWARGVGRPVAVERRELPSPGTGAAVVLAAECEGGFAGFSALGERGKPMERVAEEACAPFMDWWKSGAACDAHLADQLVLPASLATGESRWTTPEVTEHLRTVLWVVEHFLPVEWAIEEGADAATVALRSEGAG